MIERIPLPAELDTQLEAHFERSRAFFLALGERCPEALILGGGYGRGERGVVRDLEGRPCFFNDLDYFVFTKQPSHREGFCITMLSTYKASGLLAFRCHN